MFSKGLKKISFSQRYLQKTCFFALFLYLEWVFGVLWVKDRQIELWVISQKRFPVKFATQKWLSSRENVHIRGDNQLSPIGCTLVFQFLNHIFQKVEVLNMLQSLEVFKVTPATQANYRCFLLLKLCFLSS